jgi:hypothetical protein
VPLLEQTRDVIGLQQWQPRPVSELNRDLSKRYGLPVEFDAKFSGLAAVARALSRGDLVHAQIATLHLQIPDPLPLKKSVRAASEIINLARRLQASSLLKADWDPTKHPRWPTGSPAGIGGEFAPSGAGTTASTTEESTAPPTSAQLTIPVPFESPIPGTIPFPSEIVPPPVIPNINPRDIPRNPYPGRPECEEQWAEAVEYCKGLMERNQLGRGNYRGMGNFLYQCIMGQVSEDCGGNPTG